MSWDSSFKEVKCPCGKGKIEQEIKEDDWNRTKVCTPKICCETCDKKYKIITFSHDSMKPKRGSWENYYLIDKDLRCSNLSEEEVEKIAIRLDF